MFHVEYPGTMTAGEAIALLVAGAYVLIFVAYAIAVVVYVVRERRQEKLQAAWEASGRNRLGTDAPGASPAGQRGIDALHTQLRRNGDQP